ncbi:MAG: hypothetical protein EOP51_24390 [Sphingobacteriales bacterium]|nr:MAG: hypothetical protein EOP51_24390 [Sphingobacteriales bacterium]
MKKFFLLAGIATIIFSSFQAQAKIWRINNTPGLTADFSNFSAAIVSASVVDGDTLHFESSGIDYAGATLNKRLVIIGLGFFLDPANVTTPGNAGLQAATAESRISSCTINNGANGSKFLGIAMGGISINASPNPLNITFEKVYFLGGINFANASHSNVTIRKSFFNNSSIQAPNGSLSNFVVENSIFVGFSAHINAGALIGSANVIRNNTFISSYLNTLANCYVANNIASDPSYDWSFTNCTVKNNLFARASQPIPVTGTDNQVGVNMANVFVGTGSADARYQLKAGSPAIAAGLTIGTVVTPDCGAFGATDPYKLSGIPNIPSIYSYSVPTSIPAGTATMNVTFSTRNTN